MTKFNPILKKPGEVIRSEDWNKMQEDIRDNIEELERKLDALKNYMDNMQETTTLLNVKSLVGNSYNLDQVIPSERASYEAPIVGLITKQWLLANGKAGEICRFSIVACFELLDYWSGAEDGDKKALEVIFNYIDGTSATVSGLFVHDRIRLRQKGTENPYIEYLLSPNEAVWYRYQVKNPNPKKEVLNVSFRNIIAGCSPRIGNVVHYRSKLIPSQILLE
jgi:hypothetical protein